MKFPNESKTYRSSRDKLLNAEKALRKNVEAVAGLRRKLPLGGAVPEDYVFEEGDPARRVKLSELFGDRDTLVAYSYMYGPKMAKPCPSCTSILDGLNGSAPHIAQRTNLVVIAKSPIRRVLDVAEKRNWRNLRLISSADTTYNRDYCGETPEGSQMPMVNVFVRRKGAIRHFWGCELLYAKAEPGQDGRHVDLLWPLWNALDLTPEGRGTDWRPKLDYGN
jgi:predicted dithiol-disulfide oxidoreductase (DUF899 family)